MTTKKDVFIKANCSRCAYGPQSEFKCPWFAMNIPVFVGDEAWNESVRIGNPIIAGDDFDYPKKCKYLKTKLEDIAQLCGRNKE